MSLRLSTSTWLRRLVRIVSIGGLTLLMLGLIGACIIVDRTRADLPSPTDLAELRPDYGTRIQAQTGAYLGGEHAVDPVDYQQLPPMLVAAVLAAEDEDFFHHRGYNIRSIARALMTNIRAGHTTQGASTITQQVAKHFLEPDKTWHRKLQELLLARDIEADYAKVEILDAYLGGVYFGNNAWGVTQASYTYFSRSPRDLSTSQMATLAGLLPAPSVYNPVDNPQLALRERNRVLRRMGEVGFLDDDKSQELRQRSLKGPQTLPPEASQAPEAVNTVQRQWADIGGEDQWSDSSLEVTTTHHPGFQSLLRDVLQQGVEQHDRRRGYRGPVGRADDPQAFDDALGATPEFGSFAPARIKAVDEQSLRVQTADGALSVSGDDLDWLPGRDPDSGLSRSPQSDWRDFVAVDDIIALRNHGDQWDLWQPPLHQGAAIVTDHHSGEVLASVGAYDVDASQYHRAEQACRQPGSLFKTIVFAEAFSRDITPATLLSDVPDNRGVWQPRNADRDFSGYLPAHEAFVQSRNIPAVNLYQYLGASSVTERAQLMGITSQLIPTPSLALGASCTAPTEMLDAHSTIPRSGLAADRRPVATIRDLWSNRLRDRGDFLQRDPSLLARLTRAAAPVPHRERVLEPDVAYLLAQMLDDVTTRGTARDLPDHWPVGAKTGTSTHFDTWLTAIEPNLTTTIWVGSDEHNERFLSGEHAGTVALPIFADFYEGLPYQTADQWPSPPGDDVVIERVPIDPSTGLRARDHQPAVNYSFRTGTAPLEYAPTRASRQLERFDSTIHP